MMLVALTMLFGIGMSSAGADEEDDGSTTTPSSTAPSTTTRPTTTLPSMTMPPPTVAPPTGPPTTLRPLASRPTTTPSPTTTAPSRPTPSTTTRPSTTLGNGAVVELFPNGVVVTTFPDGGQIINWPDGTTTFIEPDGTQTTLDENGRIVPTERSVPSTSTTSTTTTSTPSPAPRSPDRPDAADPEPDPSIANTPPAGVDPSTGTTAPSEESWRAWLPWVGLFSVVGAILVWFMVLRNDTPKFLQKLGFSSTSPYDKFLGEAPSEDQATPVEQSVEDDELYSLPESTYATSIVPEAVIELPPPPSTLPPPPDPSQTTAPASDEQITVEIPDRIED